MFRRERETLQKLVLVPYRPFRNLSLGLGGFILIIAAGLLGFWFGRNYGISATGATPDEVQRLRETVTMYETDSRKMRDQAAIASHDREIVLAATEQLRQENKNLLATTAALEEQVALYKRLATPHAAVESLSIDKFEVSTTPVRGVLQYRLMLTRVSNNAANTTAGVEVKLIGGGRSITMPVGDGKPLSFQYFQNITGEWKMPAGFSPEQVDIVVTGKGGKVPLRSEKKFKWEVQGIQ
jgi:hypothetical protein